MNEPIFLDASFWITWRDPKDERFEMARATMARLAQSRPTLIATLLVAAETHAYFSRNRTLRNRIISDMEANTVIRMQPIGPEDEKSALELLRTHSDKSYSLCDALSFAVMKRLGIQRALSLDDHFEQIGLFRVINHPQAI